MMFYSLGTKNCLVPRTDSAVVPQIEINYRQTFVVAQCLVVDGCGGAIKSQLYRFMAGPVIEREGTKNLRRCPN